MGGEGSKDGLQHLLQSLQVRFPLVLEKEPVKGTEEAWQRGRGRSGEGGMFVKKVC